MRSTNSISNRFQSMRSYLEVRPRSTKLSNIISDKKLNLNIPKDIEPNKLQNMNQTFFMARRKPKKEKNNIRKILKS